MSQQKQSATDLESQGLHVLKKHTYNSCIRNSKKNNKFSHKSEKKTKRIGRLGGNETSKMKKYNYCKKTLKQWIRVIHCVFISVHRQIDR